MELRSEIESGWLIARWDVPTCTTPSELEAQVKDILAAWGPAPVDGEQGWFGWSMLTLRMTEEGLTVCEPDFLADDPSMALAPCVTVTAQVVGLQNRFHSLTGLDVEPCTCADTLQAVDGVFDLEELSMVRGEPMYDGDSGWIVLPVRKRDADRLQRRGGATRLLCTYALLRLRPSLLKAVTLPIGSIVTFRGSLVTSVKDYDNSELLREPDTEGDPFWLPLPIGGDPDEAVEEAPIQETVTSETGTGWLSRIFKV